MKPTLRSLPLVRRVVLACVVVLAFARGGRAGDPTPGKGGALPTARTDSLKDFDLVDLDGTHRSLREHRGAKAIVLAWTAAGCPVATVYAPRLAELAREFAPRGVATYGVSSDAEASVPELRALAKSAALPYPVLRDPSGALAQRVGARTTTTVAVLDANWRLRYVGAVDDQYGVQGRKPRADHAWLRDALESVLHARAVAVEHTDAPGCPITFASAAREAPPDAPTWSARVGAIVHARCATCHAPEQGAPFPLRTLDDVTARLAVVREVVAEGRMPPWHAEGPAGRYLNDRRLSAAEKADVLAWADAGGPAGDPTKAPAPPPVPPKDRWEIGTPDAVFAFPDPVPVPAEGVVPYRLVTVDLPYAEDRWVSAVEVQPGEPGVVHHVLVAAVHKGASRKQMWNAFEPTQGFFAAMVPGARGLVFPDGHARRLPKDSVLVFQMHYSPNGVAVADRTRIGMRFRGKPEHEVLTAGVYNPQLRIPAGAANWQVKALLPVPFDATILAFMPHMHVRGTAFRYVLVRPGKPDETLLDVPKYDFNWQTPYRLATPIEVPKGSLLKAIATYDNSAANPYNPDPTAEVRWGDQTWDEMLIGYVDYVRRP